MQDYKITLFKMLKWATVLPLSITVVLLMIHLGIVSNSKLKMVTSILLGWLFFVFFL